MQYRELAVPGAYEITPRQFGDSRGVFLEAFKAAVFAEHVGHAFDLQQANCSVSAAGATRGIHFADVPPGQAKYITCLRGAIWDVIVDLRVGSPTFGTWDAVLLDDADRRAVYLPEGLGHAFMALEDDSTVMYLCSTGYNPTGEHGIHPLDPTLAITWPKTDRAGNPITPLLSAKDEAAPSLTEALAANLLPDATKTATHIASLST
ncbi:MAG: dTDP-4-dehydrorhamnose 3,5-epimerase [Promicromonosporaceae bacterium]|nr:dTDP-4-dehydrorhamnose 3,5-epimerase [Promicromonosporaceae bacterium]